MRSVGYGVCGGVKGSAAGHTARSVGYGVFRDQQQAILQRLYEAWGLGLEVWGLGLGFRDLPIFRVVDGGCMLMYNDTRGPLRDRHGSRMGCLHGLGLGQNALCSDLTSSLMNAWVTPDAYHLTHTSSLVSADPWPFNWMWDK